MLENIFFVDVWRKLLIFLSNNYKKIENILNYQICKEMNQRLIFLRGPSGCGKSTYAKNIYPNCPVISADDFFTRNGYYYFQPNLLPTAHKSVVDRVVKCIIDNFPIIIVDNTNTQAWEMSEIAKIAINLNPLIKLEIIEPTVFNPNAFDIEHLVERNILRSSKCHGKNVPRFALEKMISRYEHNLIVDDLLSAIRHYN